MILNPLTFLVLFVAMLCAPSVGRGDCPVTLDSESPVTPPWNSAGGWYGSEALAVHLPLKGKWTGLGSAHHFRDKLWFWRRGYDSAYETRPHLVLKGRKLPATSPSKSASTRPRMLRARVGKTCRCSWNSRAQVAGA